MIIEPLPLTLGDGIGKTRAQQFEGAFVIVDKELH